MIDNVKPIIYEQELKLDTPRPSPQTDGKVASNECWRSISFPDLILVGKLFIFYFVHFECLSRGEEFANQHSLPAAHGPWSRQTRPGVFQTNG